MFDSWEEFKYGKRKKEDVQLFERHLENNLFKLHHELKNKTYKHSNYTSFHITDPKLRHIHKALVLDRIVHHALYRILYPIFDESFLFDSYSCRIDKGTHRAVRRLETFTRKVSRNYTKPCFALKCDVRKFFDSVDHEILKLLIRKKVKDADVLWLLDNIVDSFSKSKNTEGSGHQLTLGFSSPKGMPIGNLTSQLFANIYMHELDWFVKNTLKIKYYLRYCDDFMILGSSKEELTKILSGIEKFSGEKLRLSLHEDKVDIRKLGQGFDFVGYVVRPHYIVPRTKTKKRMLKRVLKKNLSSYTGLLSHCNGYSLGEKINKIVLDKERGKRA